MKIVKVKTKYRLKGYPIKYRTKTIKMELPVNQYGFTLFGTLSENVKKYLQDNDENYYKLMWHEIVRN